MANRKIKFLVEMMILGYFSLIDRLSSFYLERSNGRASESAYGHFELPIEPGFLVRTLVISKSVDASHFGTSAN